MEREDVFSHFFLFCRKAAQKVGSVSESSAKQPLSNIRGGNELLGFAAQLARTKPDPWRSERRSAKSDSLPFTHQGASQGGAWGGVEV